MSLILTQALPLITPVINPLLCAVFEVLCPSGRQGSFLFPFFNACSLGSKGRGPWMSPHCCLKKAWCGENAATLMLFSLLYRVALQKHYWHCCYAKHFKDVFHTEAELSKNYNLAAGFWFWFLLSCRTSCYCAA